MCGDILLFFSAGATWRCGLYAGASYAHENTVYVFSVEQILKQRTLVHSIVNGKRLLYPGLILVLYSAIEMPTFIMNVRYNESIIAPRAISL